MIVMIAMRWLWIALESRSRDQFSFSVRAQVEHLVDRPQVQGRRRPQPSGTNRPSSYPHHRAPGRPAWVSERSSPVGRPSEDEVRPSLCGPQGTRNKGRIPGGRSAAHRSAAIACGARPVPFRTRKLSRTAPMVLRGKPVGEQGAADRWTALRARRGGHGVPWPPRALSGARGPPFLF